MPVIGFLGSDSPAIWLPALFGFREFAVARGLDQLWRQPQRGIASSASTSAVSSMAKGLPTCRLPQATKVELIIDLKTAGRLGLNIPLPILGREVIE